MIQPDHYRDVKIHQKFKVRQCRGNWEAKRGKEGKKFRCGDCEWGGNWFGRDTFLLVSFSLLATGEYLFWAGETCSFFSEDVPCLFSTSVIRTNIYMMKQGSPIGIDYINYTHATCEEFPTYSPKHLSLEHLYFVFHWALMLCKIYLASPLLPETRGSILCLDLCVPSLASCYLLYSCFDSTGEFNAQEIWYPASFSSTTDSETTHFAMETDMKC